MWNYEKQKRFDKKGARWHFASQDYIEESSVPYEESPFELYFRNDDKTIFGVLKFERKKDNPYRDYEMMVDKIMNNADFRKSLINPGTEAIWRSSWK
jgi:hypothetical protein